MLRFAGVRTSSCVLDAGCGNGAYLPQLIEEVGPDGRVVAMDLDATNMQIVRRDQGVDGAVGSIVSLPFASGRFDALWCANTVQYLTDDELAECLGECRRVVKPGGVVAVKDVDMMGARFLPCDPFLLTHLSEVSLRMAGAPPETRGSLRGRELKNALEAAGLKDVRQRSLLIERAAPLREVEREFYAAWITYLAEIAEERGVPDEDVVQWRAMVGEDGGRSFASRPDFYACELQVVAVGVVS